MSTEHRSHFPSPSRSTLNDGALLQPERRHFWPVAFTKLSFLYTEQNSGIFCSLYLVHHFKMTKRCSLDRCTPSSWRPQQQCRSSFLCFEQTSALLEPCTLKVGLWMQQPGWMHSFLLSRIRTIPFPLCQEQSSTVREPSPDFSMATSHSLCGSMSYL